MRSIQNKLSRFLKRIIMDRNDFILEEAKVCREHQNKIPKKNAVISKQLTNNDQQIVVKCDYESGLEIKSRLNKMKKLATVVGPSILSADFASLRSECQNVLDLGADSLHIDIMDGHFVNNLTIGPPVVVSLRKSLPTAHLDCHLMVTHPENYLQPLSKAQINCFTFHYQAQYNGLRQFLRKIRQHKISTGVSIKPATPVPAQLIDLAKEGLIDKILVMTVEPGFGAQKFIEDTLPKIKQLRENLSDIDIQVDGGLNEQTTKKAASHGANCIVAGSSIFGAKDRKEAISKIKQAANTHLNELLY